MLVLVRMACTGVTTAGAKGTFQGADLLAQTFVFRFDDLELGAMGGGVGVVLHG